MDFPLIFAFFIASKTSLPYSFGTSTNVYLSYISIAPTRLPGIPTEPHTGSARKPPNNHTQARGSAPTETTPDSVTAAERLPETTSCPAGFHRPGYTARQRHPLYRTVSQAIRYGCPRSKDETRGAARLPHPSSQSATLSAQPFLSYSSVSFRTAL